MVDVIMRREAVADFTHRDVHTLQIAAQRLHGAGPAEIDEQA
jgi:hypothetical protein